MRPGPSAAVLFAAAFLGFAGCASVGRGARRCPESVEKCLTPVDCVEDRERGCVMCACRAWDETKPRSGAAADAVPEESRPPPQAR